MSAAILVIEDDRTLGNNLSRYLTRHGFSVETASTGREGLSAIDSFKPDIILADLNLPDMSGIELTKTVIETDPAISIIIMTGAGSVQVAVEAMKAGAIDYLAKPIILKELKILLEKTLADQQNASILDYYQNRTAQQSGIEKLHGNSLALQQIKQKISQFCRAEFDLSDTQPPTVLITGETGCGKELVARAFHFDGPRKEQPFVEINCASIPGHLLEAELFGYERGAFTDAKQRKIGLVDAANGGTLFLDEIGEMEMVLQAKLLTLLENRKIRRLGNVHEHDVNIRVIAATNQNLDTLVAEGKFRRDLYYRLKVIHLEVPPLRQRGADIRLLADLFLEQQARRYRKQSLVFSSGAYERLLSHHWPGNVRELKNTIEQAVLLCNVSSIEPEHLMISTTVSQQETDEGAVPAVQSLNLHDHEVHLIQSALNRVNGNISKAANLLGLSRDTLRYRLSKYGLNTD